MAPTNDFNEKMTEVNSPKPQGAKKLSFASVLRIRNFVFLSLSGAVSQLGDRFTHMLLITLIESYRPRSSFAYSQASITFTLPNLLLAPFVGVLVDRWEKKGIMIKAHYLQAFILFFTPFLIYLTKSFLPVFFVLFLFFGIDLFNNTAKPSLIPVVVAKRKLLLANSLDTTFTRMATVFGMVIGGFLIKWAGWRLGFFINALTHFTAGSLILGMKLPPIPSASAPIKRPLKEELLFGFREFLVKIRELLLYLFKEKIVLFVISSIFLLAAIASFSYAVLIFLIQQILRLGTSGVGIFAGILAVGMITGSFLLSLIKPEINKKLLILYSLIPFSFLFLIGSFLIKIWFMVLVGIVAGILFSIITICQNTILHEEVPEYIRGRIFATKEFLNNLGFILTVFPIGLLADLTSCKAMLFLSGLSILFISILGIIYLRRWKS
uniref:MFS transporter n=1 Tax=candidate division WOR-3 bacterium TaxID=2052148 RepID=A0A7C3UU76_UNCW3